MSSHGTGGRGSMVEMGGKEAGDAMVEEDASHRPETIGRRVVEGVGYIRERCIHARTRSRNYAFQMMGKVYHDTVSAFSVPYARCFSGLSVQRCLGDVNISASLCRSAGTLCFSLLLRCYRDWVMSRASLHDLRFSRLAMFVQKKVVVICLTTQVHSLPSYRGRWSYVTTQFIQRVIA